MTSTLTDTQPGPPGSVTDEETGQRYYLVDGEQFWSVTTALNIMSKDGLPPWAGGLAAKAAFAELPKVIVASRTKPCGHTYSQCGRSHDWRIRCSTCPCRECQTCVTRMLGDRHLSVRNRRADEGKRTHDVIEYWVLNGGVIRPHLDDIVPYVRAFKVFVDKFGLTPDSWLFTECTVLNRAEKFAGTTDGVLRIDATTTVEAAKLVAMLHQQPASVCIAERLTADVVVDWKTTEKQDGDPVKFFDGVALQIAGYRHSPMIRLKNSTDEFAMPDTHGGLAVQLRLDCAVPRLCVVDDDTYQAFLWALYLYRWRIERGTASVSSRSFKVPPEPKPVKVAKRAAPAKATPVRKTAAKKAAVKTTSPEPAALLPLRETAMQQSSIMRSLRPATEVGPTPHPNSAYNDEIPF